MARPSPLSSTRQTCLGSHSGLCVWGEVSVSIYLVIIIIIKTLLIILILIITLSPGCC